MRVLLCVFFGYDLMATIDVVSGEINDPEAAQACDGLVSYLALEAATVQIEKERHYRKGSLAELDLPRFRGEMRAWDQALWLYVMLPPGLVAFIGSAPWRRHSSVL